MRPTARGAECRGDRDCTPDEKRRLQCAIRFPLPQSGARFPPLCGDQIKRSANTEWRFFYAKKSTDPERGAVSVKLKEAFCELTPRTVTALGLLLAIEIVLSRFLSISAWNIKIGFSFVPIVLAAMLYGPIPAALVAALGDFLGALLFPIGPYFPGFTLTAFLTGLTFGLFLYRRGNLLRAVCAVLIAQPGLSLLLNSLWISVLYGSPYAPLLVTRLPQTAILSAAELVVILAILHRGKLISALKER